MAGIKHQELTVETTKTAKPKPPSMYSVILFNDDFTPMEFVVGIKCSRLNYFPPTANLPKIVAGCCRISGSVMSPAKA